MSPENQASVEKNWVSEGIWGGIIAGLVFALAEMIMNAFLGKTVLGPLRLISSIILGREALTAEYSLLTASIVGVLVHLVFAALFGVVFMYFFRKFHWGKISDSSLLIYSSLFGMVLWIINFFIFAPLFWPQFTNVNQFWNGFAAHTFFYGTVIGLFILALEHQEQPAR